MPAETMNVIMIILIVLVGGFGAYQMYRRGEAVTAGTVVNAINAAPSVITEVNNAATTVVQSIEQARRKGKLTNEPALDEVMNKVRGWLPDWAKVSVSNDQIIEAINSAILMASAVSAQIAASKATVVSSDTTPQPLDSPPQQGAQPFSETFTGRHP